MDLIEILLIVIPPVITWVIGLFQNKPGYTKFKAVNAAIAKGLEDNKLTRAEAQAIVDALK